MDLPVSAEDHVYAHLAPPRGASANSSLALHFYVKKVEEEQILEVERAAVTVASDHGNEVTPPGWGRGFPPWVWHRLTPGRPPDLQVLGMVRVPLYSFRDGRGLGSFLSHGFIGNARTQLVDSLLRLELVGAKELHRALGHALRTSSQSAQDLKAAQAMTAAKEKHP